MSIEIRICDGLGGSTPRPEVIERQRQELLGLRRLEFAYERDFNALSQEEIDLNDWFAARLRDLRVELRVRTLDLADTSGTSVEFMIFLFSGRVSLRNEQYRPFIELVAKALGTNIADILDCKAPNLTTGGRTRSQTAEAAGMMIADIDRVRAGVEQQEGESFDDYLKRLGLSRPVYFAIKAYLFDFIPGRGGANIRVLSDVEKGFIKTFGEPVPHSVRYCVVDGIPYITATTS